MLCRQREILTCKNEHPSRPVKSGTSSHSDLGLLAVVDPAKYSAIEILRDGRRVEIRAVTPDDRGGLVEAVGRASAESLYRRFFAVRRNFSEQELTFFSDVDFVRHTALIAVVEEGGRPVVVGGGRYVVVESRRAEVAFAIVDQFQGQGLGAALMRHLAALARAAGLKELIAEVLPENTPMLKVFKKSALPMSTRRESGVVHVTLQLS
jgi:GNAT superfamily N-acetyltransferase